MKKLGLVLLSIIITINSYSQADTTKIKVLNKEIVTIADSIDGTNIKIGEKGFFKLDNRNDTTKIKLGKKGISIIENEDGTSIKVIDLDDEIFDEDDEDYTYNRKNFRGHWSGFEIGINNYLDNDFSMTLPAGSEFMELNTGKSWNVNINFLQYSLPVIRSNFGFVTGLGFEMTNYHFDNNNNIRKDDLAGFIVDTTYTFNTEKSKLSATYLTLPVILEFQIPAGRRSKRFYLGGGVIAGVKLGSHSKVVYRDSGKKQKDKVRDDFNLSPLRCGVTARIGYRALRVFANYYFTSLFETNKGPELYPFSIGLVITRF